MALIKNKMTQMADGATWKVSDVVGTSARPAAIPAVNAAGGMTAPYAKNSSDYVKDRVDDLVGGTNVGQLLDAYKQYRDGRMGMPPAVSPAVKAGGDPQTGGGTGGGNASALYNGYLTQLQNGLAAQQALYDRQAEAARTAQQQAYEYGLGQLQGDATDSQRANYVNMMQNQRRMGQILAAQGIGGGAAQSTAAAMLNNYLTAQNAVRNQLAQNQAALYQQLQQELAAIEQQRLAQQAAAQGEHNADAASLYAKYLAALT